MEFSSNIKFVIAYEWGRLGNQLFQYAAIKKIAPSACVLNIGMHSLLRWLADDQAFRGFFIRSLVIRLLENAGNVKLLGMSGKGRLFSLISERLDGDQCVLDFQMGLIPQIALLKGFFQDEQTLLGVETSALSINLRLIHKATKWIRKQTDLPSTNHYFVHIRRGDYTAWPSRAAPAVLSADWYIAQMKRILEVDNVAQFFVFSDDIPYAEEILRSFDNVFISRRSELDDLAAMSLCLGGGVLSASTFSWWGAFYSKQNNPMARFYAPRFWAGWRKARWFPGSIETSWIQYVDAF